MKVYLLIAGMVILHLIFVFGTVTVAVRVDENLQLKSGNENYTFNTTMDFSLISINETWVKFNDTDFNVSTDPDLSIGLVINYLNEDIASLTIDELALSFNSTTCEDPIYFNLSGFVDGVKYNISRAGVFLDNCTANASGYISFVQPSTGIETYNYRYDITEARGGDEGGWNKFLGITIESDYIEHTLTDFPILVEINTTIGEQCDGGNSIRFNNSDNTTELVYEIESWNDSGNSYVWVNVTTISNSTDTIIWMRYNNSEATDAQNPSGVWNSHYIAVYHMNDSTTSTIIDSTSNSNDGTKNGANEPVESTGKIADAQSFNENGTDNFGFENTSSFGRDIDDNIAGSLFTTGANAVYATNITAYIYNQAEGTAVVKCALYNSTSYLVAYTEELEVVAETTAWYTFEFENYPVLSASSNYYIVAYGEEYAVHTLWLNWDTNEGTTGLFYEDIGSYGDFPENCSFTKYNDDDTNVCSIYCTYYTLPESGSDVIACGNNSVFDVTNLTVSCWFNPRSTGSSSYSRLCGIELSNSAYPWAVERDGDVIYLFTDLGSGETQTSSIDVSWNNGSDFNTWTHGAWTFTNGTQLAYKDGVSDNSASESGELNNQNSHFRIGNSDNGDREFDGYIDEVRVSDVARNATWIGAEYDSTNQTSGFITMGEGGDLPDPYYGPYYVSKSGNDNNNGTFSEPFLTIQKALDSLVDGEGNTIYIREGNYNERVYVNDSGNDTLFTTIQSYEGEIVVLDGNGFTLSETDGIFHMENVSHINVSNITVENSTQNGIRVKGIQSHNIHIYNCTVENTTIDGIKVNPHTSTYGFDGDYIYNVSITHCELINVTTSDVGSSLIVAKVQNCTISHNYIHNQSKETINANGWTNNITISYNQINVTDASLGIYVDTWDSNGTNISIYNNHIFSTNNSTGVGISLDHEKGGAINNITIYNNIVDSVINCFSLGSNSTDAGWHCMKRNITVVNNNFHNPSGNCMQLGSYELHLDNLTVQNNILSGGDYKMINVPNMNESNFTFTYNFYTGEPNSGYTGTGSIQNSDVQFNDTQEPNPLNKNFRLNTSSLAIDNGTGDNAPSFDYAGDPRPLGNYDMGAYERALNESFNLTGHYPLNTSTEVTRPPTNLSVGINGTGLDLSIYFLNMTDTTNSWILLQTWSGVNDGWYKCDSFNMTDMVWGNTTYYWTSNLTNGTAWNNKTFHYTTVQLVNGQNARYDVSNNGLINVQDLSYTWSHRTGETTYEGIYDVNNNDLINVQDLSFIWANRT